MINALMPLDYHNNWGGGSSVSLVYIVIQIIVITTIEGSSYGYI